MNTGNKNLQPLAATRRIDTPLGALLLAATPAGLAGAWFDGQAHHPGPLEVRLAAAGPVERAAAQAHLARAEAELRAFFDGSGAAFTVPLDPAGTPFQRAVWQALRALAPGEVTSYGKIARGIGRERAVRAAGAAIGRNPISIVVPCHRVLGRDGALTGYAGGIDRKRALLAHEQARWPDADARADAAQDLHATATPAASPARRPRRPALA